MSQGCPWRGLGGFLMSSPTPPSPSPMSSPAQTLQWCTSHRDPPHRVWWQPQVLRFSIHSSFSQPTPDESFLEKVPDAKNDLFLVHKLQVSVPVSDMITFLRGLRAPCCLLHQPAPVWILEGKWACVCECDPPAQGIRKWTPRSRGDTEISKP